MPPVVQITCLATLLMSPVGQAADNSLPMMRVPAGFAATVFHSALGPTRHIAARDNEG